MNILIIGASGFIGQCLYNRARQNGHIVLGTRFSRGDSELLSFDLTRQDIFDIVPADFWEADEMAAVICSAIPKIDLCYRDKAGSTFLNVTRTIDLIDKLQARNVKTVFLSTDAVFDGIQGYYDETNHPNPLNEYGRQKQEVENYLLATHAESLIVRMGMVVGDDPASSHLFAEWYQKICNKQAIACIKGQVFSPTFVDDVADAIMIALERNLSGIYHITNPEYFERIELARQFLLILGVDAVLMEKEVHEFNFLQGRAITTYMDSYKFRMETRMPFTSMKEVIKRFKENLKHV